ncbi:protein eva-1 homolog C-like isoform X2 [Ptychodera flava]|uniref:protein eva-1 homolog C-like isoform X2 n=1 Tax=Ptychodera flava TaxID=63121 RepID=UPI00396A6FA7
MTWNFHWMLFKMLQTKIVLACDGELLSLKCPQETAITIQMAQYGRFKSHGVEMCPVRWSPSKSPYDDSTACLASDTYKVVMDRCQDKKRCKIEVNNNLFGPDPCPLRRKYLEVTYKCRPNEFRSVVACDNTELLLECSSSKVLAIYSAMYGRSQYGNMKCPSSVDVGEDCLSTVALEMLMVHCHGKKSCNIPATTTNFGDPCRPNVGKYLDVVYTCVSRRILRKPRKYHSLPEISGLPSYLSKPGTSFYDLTSISPLMPAIMTEESPLDLVAEENSTLTVTEAIIKSGYNVTSSNELIGPAPVNEMRPLGLASDIMSTMGFIKSHKKEVILYMAIAVCIGIALFFAMVVIDLAWKNRKMKLKAKKKEQKEVVSLPPKNEEEEEEEDEEDSLSPAMHNHVQNRDNEERYDSLRRYYMQERDRDSMEILQYNSRVDMSIGSGNTLPTSRNVNNNYTRTLPTLRELNAYYNSPSRKYAYTRDRGMYGTLPSEDYFRNSHHTFSGNVRTDRLWSKNSRDSPPSPNSVTFRDRSGSQLSSSTVPAINYNSRPYVYVQPCNSTIEFSTEI